MVASLTTTETTAMPFAAREFLSKAEFGAIIGVSPRTMTQMLSDGRIACVKLGGTVRIHVSELDRLRQEARRRAP